jgi:tellurite methyltransferase
MAFTNQKTIFEKLVDESALPRKGRALDLGCGKGQDACTLAGRGFEVDAVDKNQELLDGIKSERGDIHLFNVSIEDFKIQKNTYGLIVASFSLQFLPKEDAKEVIRAMIDGTVASGILIFNLIGDRDEWANNPKWSTWERGEITDFLKKFPVHIRNFNEKEGTGYTMSRDFKYWHVYEIVLVKK